MKKTTILVVEDESIVAKDIQSTLIKLGYDVPATASSAVIAYDKLKEIRPDLVFLDIKLKGDEDGITIAAHIQQHYQIPVIFLTSYVDQATLDRAKVTEPYGYIVKPFNETDLKTTVEMALFKFGRDKEVRDKNQRMSNALAQVDEAIILTDTDCRVTYLNGKAETMLGYGADSAVGVDLFTMMAIEQEGGASIRKEDIVTGMMNNEAMEYNDCFVLVKRENTSVASSITSSPIRDEKDNLIGTALVIMERQQGMDKADRQAVMQNTFIEHPVIQNSFFVKKGSMLVKVYLDNISWIQAMDNYVIIQTNTDQFVIHSTMKDIEAKLPNTKFLRVHRSYIIPIDKINVLDENTVLIGDKTIPIGKSYKDTFMARLNFL
ncbi:MAG: response regulator [Bacteroidota bacterium]